MKPLYHLAMISLAVMSSAPTFADPYSPSCAIALERIDKARNALIPFRRSMEMVTAHEYGAHAEALICIADDRIKGNPPMRCQKSQWRAPKPHKYDLAAVEQYRQERQAFEDLFKHARQICLLER